MTFSKELKASAIRSLQIGFGLSPNYGMDEAGDDYEDQRNRNKYRRSRDLVGNKRTRDSSPVSNYSRIIRKTDIRLNVIERDVKQIKMGMRFLLGKEARGTGGGGGAGGFSLGALAGSAVGSITGAITSAILSPQFLAAVAGGISLKIIERKAESMMKKELGEKGFENFKKKFQKDNKDLSDFNKDNFQKRKEALKNKDFEEYKRLEAERKKRNNYFSGVERKYKLFDESKKPGFPGPALSPAKPNQSLQDALKKKYNKSDLPAAGAKPISATSPSFLPSVPALVERKSRTDFRIGGVNVLDSQGYLKEGIEKNSKVKQARELYMQLGNPDPLDGLPRRKKRPDITIAKKSMALPGGLTSPTMGALAGIPSGVLPNRGFRGGMGVGMGVVPTGVEGSFTPKDSSGRAKSFHGMNRSVAKILNYKPKPDSALGGLGRAVGNTTDAIGEMFGMGSKKGSIPPEGIALLNTIAAGEARRTGDPYKSINYAAVKQYGAPTHFKGNRHPFEGRSGVTASGRYQFLWNTWKKEAERLGIDPKDFSNKNQDLAAWSHAQRVYKIKTGRNLLEDIKNPENHASITQALRPTWHGIKGGAYLSKEMAKSNNSLPSGGPSGSMLGSKLAGIGNSVSSFFGSLGKKDGKYSKDGVPMNDIVKAGKWLQKQGIRVSEHPSFGGVSNVHKGASHYEHRSIDVNIGRGNVEWNNPKQKAIFDKLAEKLKRGGYRVIWGAAGHKNHMHVEIPRGNTYIADKNSANKGGSDSSILSYTKKAFGAVAKSIVGPALANKVASNSNNSWMDNIWGIKTRQPEQKNLANDPFVSMKGMPGSYSLPDKLRGGALQPGGITFGLLNKQGDPLAKIPNPVNAASLSTSEKYKMLQQSMNPMGFSPPKLDTLSPEIKNLKETLEKKVDELKSDIKPLSDLTKKGITKEVNIPENLGGTNEKTMAEKKANLHRKGKKVVASEDATAITDSDFY